MIVTEAGYGDCAALAETSKRAFDADVSVGAPGLGGPPGYDSVEWHQEAMTWGRVFTITVDGRLLGGAVVVVESATKAYLGRIWLVPEAQNRGLGGQAMAAIESAFPTITRWRLGTPTWNERNQRFYARCGYRVIGPEGEDGVLFEKLVKPGPLRD